MRKMYCPTGGCRRNFYNNNEAKIIEIALKVVSVSSGCFALQSSLIISSYVVLCHKYYSECNEIFVLSINVFYAFPEFCTQRVKVYEIPISLK